MAGPSVIVLAAGQGTRMRSSVPKVLHPICGRPMVLWPVLAALQAGAGRVVVVGGPDRALEDVLPEGVTLVVQPEPRGTGDAVRAAAEHIDPDGPVVILSGDVPLVDAATVGELLDAHEARAAAGTVGTMILTEPGSYGRIVRDADGWVQRIVETKAPGDATDEELAIEEVNAGLYVFHGAALQRALPQLGADNAQGEYYLPDVLPHLGGPVAGVVITDPAASLGVNDRADLARVTGLARARINDAHMRAGVTLVDPDATYLDADVMIGPDTVVGPGVVLQGGTMVGAGCRIGPYVVAIDAVLHDGAIVGPFAYLRPGTVLHPGAKVGTFVEVKNSDIGAGTKVPHLSYIGDTEIGESSNIGAGTITANYDGFRKHRTTIGSRVRVSVDTSFVAPVSVGDDAVTGAGSVITKDVPPGALGIARERQRNIAGYAERANSGNAAPAGEPAVGDES